MRSQQQRFETMSVYASLTREERNLGYESRTKSQRFRLQIRQRQKQQYFHRIRRDLCLSQKCIETLSLLKEHFQKQQKFSTVLGRWAFTDSQIKWILLALENQSQNYHLYVKIQQFGIHKYLGNLVFEKNLNLQTRKEFMNFLVKLIFYNENLHSFFCNKSFLLNLLNILEDLHLEKGESLQKEFAFSTLSLMQNLTYLDKQFAQAMMEPEMEQKIVKFLDLTNQYQHPQLTIVIMKIYKNILYFQFCLDLPKIVQLLCKISKNMKNIDVVNQSLICLSLVSKRQRSEVLFTETEILFELICIGLNISQEIAKNPNDSFMICQCGLKLAQILQTLQEEEEQVGGCDIITILKELGKLNIFYQAITSLFSNQHSSSKQKSERFKIAKGFFKVFSKTEEIGPRQYLYQTKREQFALLQICLKPRFFEWEQSMYMCKLISKILEEDKTCIDFLLENNILDLIHLSIEKGSQIEKQTIKLMQLLISVAQQFKSSEHNCVVIELQANGVIRDIDMWILNCNQYNLENCSYAENFIENISALEPTL